MGSKSLKKIASVALPIAASYFAPGIGTALGSSLSASTLGGIGGALGGGLGGLAGGGGIKGILGGAALGGAGGYLGNGGASDLLGGTKVGDAFGLSNANLGYNPGEIASGSLGSTVAPAASSGSSYAGIAGNILSAGLGTDANDEAKKALLRSQEQNTALLSPFLNEKFDGSDLYDTPGYKFQLEQGTKALDAANAARGNYYSGGALQDAAKYTTGLADSTYNNAYNQFLQTQAQKIGAAGGLTNINDTAANAIAGAGVNNSNILSQSLAGILGGRGITNTGAVNDNDQYAAILKKLLGTA